MILYKISPTDNEVRRTDQVAQSVAAVRVGEDSLIDKVLDGECSFLTDIGAWVFGSRIRNGAGDWFDVEDVTISAHLMPKDETPGNADLHTIEARKDGALVLRSACAIAEGVDIKIPTAAGQAG
jgi:hypothetical protein